MAARLLSAVAIVSALVCVVVDPQTFAAETNPTETKPVVQPNPAAETNPNAAPNAAAEDARRQAEDRANKNDQTNPNDEGGPGTRHSGDLGGQIRDLGGATEIKDNNHAPPPPKKPPKKVAVAHHCDDSVLSADDFIKAIAEGAAKGGYAPRNVQNSSDPGAQLSWDQALQNEAGVQDHLEHEFSRLQGDVAKAINQYLGAASDWQVRFTYISSSTTGLQGLLTQWTESRAILEKADFAFAMANLGVGGVKLGFKAVRWISKARAAALAAAEAEAAANLAKATGTIAEAGSAGEVVGGATRTTKDLGKGGVYKALPQPGSVGAATPVAPNQIFAPVAAVSDEGALLRSSGIRTALRGTAAEDVQLQAQIRKMERLVDKARALGNTSDVARIQADINKLTIAKTRQMALAGLSPEVQTLAKEAGVDTAKVAGETSVAPEVALEAVRDNAESNTALGGVIDEVEMTILRKVAESRGWHEIPDWANKALGQAIIESRKALAGVEGANISGANVEVINSLKIYIESKGLNFNKWLSTAATETAMAGRELGSNGVRTIYEDTGNAIVLYYTKADVELINNILAANGNLTKLRALVGPIDQISLNAIALANAPRAICRIAKPGQQATAQAGTPAVAKPTEQQLHNVLEGTGRLGEVGIDNVMDEFGLADRVKNKGLVRAGLGEMWELFTSPSATVGSHYYSWVALSELEDLLKNNKTQLLELGTKLDDAARGLSNLQTALERSGINKPDSYLGKQASDRLKKALDDLQKAFDSGNEGWKKDHKAQMDERKKHIEKKLADLADAVKDLQALDSRVGQLRQWLDSVRLNPDKSVKTPLQAFNPQTFVRISSISMYLRTSAASAFGLTQDVPFHLVPANFDLPTPTPAARTATATPGSPGTGDSSLPPNRRTPNPDLVQPDGPGSDVKEDKAFDDLMHSIWREERKAWLKEHGQNGSGK